MPLCIQEGSGKVEEPKFIEMRNDLHEFDISDTDLYGHARDRAFYNALRKALFECICESVESRRIAKVDATHNWFLKSHPGNQNLVGGRKDAHYFYPSVLPSSFCSLSLSTSSQGVKNSPFCSN